MRKLVILEREEEASLISLNDEGSFNSLSEGLLKELFAALKEADEDHSTKVLILRGVGRGFSAGHNLKEVQGNQDESFYRNLMACSKKVMTILPNLNKPVILFEYFHRCHPISHILLCPSPLYLLEPYFQGCLGQ